MGGVGRPGMGVFTSKLNFLCNIFWEDRLSWGNMWGGGGVVGEGVGGKKFKTLHTKQFLLAKN